MRQSAPLLIVLVSSAILSSCGSPSPTSPTSVPSAAAGIPGAAHSSTASGTTIDAISGAPLASLTVALDNGLSTVTGADGAFHLAANETGPCAVTVTGPGVVQRQTTITMPASNAALSLIPAPFDLSTFDQMIRDGGTLHRWTAAPSLVIIDAVLRFTSVNDSTFTASSERLTAEERDSIVADLEWGLPQVTGTTFATFASVKIESPAAGTSVNFFSREGSIVVARFSGLTQGTGYWGYGRSARRGDAVVAGAIMLDRDFEMTKGPYLRSLRVHEMGHALGYCHVTRQSFMNAAAIYEPNDFDRDATRIAFQRTPGNLSPDRDPSQPGAALHSGVLSWGAIMP